MTARIRRPHALAETAAEYGAPAAGAGHTKLSITLPSDLVDFGDVGGHVLRGPHPALVIRTDRLARSSTVIVAPMTSAARAADFEPPFLVPVTARESGLPRDGWIKCDQPATLPTSMLGPRVGRLSPAAIERLDAALRFVLGL